MEYTSDDIYWEDETKWFKAKKGDKSYYFHNNELSCWVADNKVWSGDYENHKYLINSQQIGLTWKLTDSRFIRDCIKINHAKDTWRGRQEHSHLKDGLSFGNQASTYSSILGKGDKRRFTMLLDDDLYEDIVSSAQERGIRRNTFLNVFIREAYENTAQVEV